ncbi:uncharacterized protein LOC123680192 [Harmonia axyridis]|uniref:uncharacterized protein LOC123680192 n=1 Tax=Harmonia axyridis TaxID=115357 RepID=UPI001E2752C6|nr:uncharacterized protein LOC123680192 [Harmonia axyridis]
MRIWYSIFCLIYNLIVNVLCNKIADHRAEEPIFSKTISKFISSLSVLVDKEHMDEEELWNDTIIEKIEEKVKFQLFNELYPEGKYINTTEDIKSSDITKDQPVIFITHGWLSGGREDMCTTIKDRYLSLRKVNVFIVHWDVIALSYLYMLVVKKLQLIADYYADFLMKVIALNSLDPQNIHLIGHSLGAHLSGLVGKKLASNGMKVGRITGLDPALPGYQDYFGFEKLAKWDAKFVDIIHTCGGSLGMMEPLGHVDFYPNGGSFPMPGCEGFWSQKQCSHSRSWQYFAESINHPFVAVKCVSFDAFQTGRCSQDYIELGNNISTKARGSFYFSTSNVSPYTMGKNGTLYSTKKIVEETASESASNDLFSCQLSCKKQFFTKKYLQNLPPINFSLADVSKSDVDYKLHQREDNVGIPVTEQNIASSITDVDIPTIVLIHGWSSYNKNAWYENFIQRYFQLKRCNIICVYWSPASTKPYLTSSASTKMVGTFVADLLAASMISTSNIHIIGHSLGAHVAGFASKVLMKKGKGQLRRITAFDPAAPAFEHKYVSDAFRLSSGDAAFVDVYHTDAGCFGYIKPIGHVDFYPNNGRNQPDENDEIYASTRTNSHNRAISYFEETINCQEFYAFPATITVNEFEYKLDVNFQGEKVVIGEHIPPSTRGVFYFKTNSISPYLLKNN